MACYFIAHLKKLDWVMIVAAVLLVSIGLVAIYSSSVGKEEFLNFKKQLVFLGLGMVILLAVSLFDWRALRENPYLILVLYGLSVALLIGLFFFAPATRGVKAWYRMGPLSFEPTELMKIVLIILLAKYFSMRHVEMYRLRHIIFSGIYVLIPAVLIFRQPDLGSALILGALWFGILIISGIKMRHFVLLLVGLLILAAVSWGFLLQDYQKERIVSFLVPDLDPLGISWNQRQAEIAIGSGGLMGQGFLQGSQARHGFLPEPHTDFIFAAIAEEFGLVGVCVLFALFLIFLWRVMKIALQAQSNFPRLFAAGFAIIIFAHLIINVGMNLGMLPVIGIPLSLVSYGGSSLITLFIGIGILQSIKTH